MGSNLVFIILLSFIVTKLDSDEDESERDSIEGNAQESWGST